MSTQQEKDLSTALIEHAQKAKPDGMKFSGQDWRYTLFIVLPMSVALVFVTGTFLAFLATWFLWFFSIQRRGIRRFYAIPGAKLRSLRHQRFSKGVTYSETDGVVRRRPIPLQNSKITLTDVQGQPTDTVSFYRNLRNKSDTIYLFSDGSEYTALDEHGKRVVIRRFEEMNRRLWSRSGLTLTISSGSHTRPIDKWQLAAREIQAGGGPAQELARGYQQAAATGMEEAFIAASLARYPGLDEYRLQGLIGAGLAQLENNDTIVRQDCETREYYALTVTSDHSLGGNKRQKRKRKGMSAKDFRQMTLMRLVKDAQATLTELGVQGLYAPDLAVMRGLSNSALSLGENYQLWRAHYPQVAGELREETIKRLNLPPKERQWSVEDRNKFNASGGESRHWPTDITETDEYCIVDGTYHSTIAIQAIPEKYILPSFWMVLNNLPAPWYSTSCISTLANTMARSVLMGMTIIPATEYALSKLSKEIPQQKNIDAQRERRDQLADSGIESRDIHLVTVSARTFEDWEKSHDDTMSYLESKSFKPLHVTGGEPGLQISLVLAGTLGVPLYNS